ncbi:Gfo/Idh/MocA family protein [Kushneria aurantia]|uniref:Gfo/Idh/MocA family protein n=1 Tax=Kushneria aurantia TaxID=504092 RepID=A0ABV6G568_9GAMM|nr:Gfo/Idh/MocA family oxidoreductase [Kushneria aurantia]
MKSIAIMGCRHPHWSDYVARILATPGVRLSHLHDRDGEALADALKDTATIRFDPAQPNEGISAFLLMSETSLHVADALCLLGWRRPLFIEKPLAASRHEVRTLAQAIHAAEVPFHTGFFLRREPTLCRARQLIVGGQLGTLHYVRVRFSHGGMRSGWLRDSWVADPHFAGHGAFGDLAIHCIDLMHWWGIAPLEPERAALCHIFKGPGDDSGVGWLNHPNGVAIVEAGWAAGDWPMLDIELHGSLGALRTRDRDLEVHFNNARHSEKLGTLKPDAGEGLKPFLHGLVSGDWSECVDIDQAVRANQVILDLLDADVTPSQPL